MKRLFLFVLPFLFLTPANAASEPTNFAISKDKILLIGNLEKTGYFQIEGGTQIPLTGPSESFVSAISVDPDGNFLVFGSGATTSTSNNVQSVAPINPDGVVVEPQTTSRTNATQIWRWKIAPTGEVLEAKGVDVGSAVWIKSAFGNLLGGQIATESGSAGFYMKWDGTSNQINLIGKTNTEVNVIINENYLAGSSTEKLLGKNLVAKRDGFLLKLNKPAIVRSSNINAERRWISGTTNYFLGGSAKVGKTTEAVVTKFTSAFAPTWTTRFPAVGGAHVVSVKKNFMAAYPIKGGKISIITFDGKGKVLAKKSITGSKINAFGYSDEVGAVLMADSSLNRLTSR